MAGPLLSQDAKILMIPIRYAKFLKLNNTRDNRDGNREENRKNRETGVENRQTGACAPNPFKKP